MNEYIFLFALAFVWIVFAVVQDLRTREISNWLNFSLIALVLAYRAFYSVLYKDFGFFLFGLLGVLLFVGLAYGLYYGRAFAGGDAKLLMGIGGIFPYHSFLDLIYYGFGFVFVLFSVGAIYSLIYTSVLFSRNWNSFVRAFKKEFILHKYLVLVSIVLAIVFQVWIFIVGTNDFVGVLSLFFVVFALLYIYLKAIDKSCMVKEVTPDRLTEGDWLVKDIKIGEKVIRKTVHGLSYRDIKVLIANKKKVLIREGIPFTPAFLAALLVAFVYLRYSPF